MATVSIYSSSPAAWENVRLRHTPDYYTTHSATVELSCSFSIDWTGSGSVVIEYGHAPLFDDGATQSTTATTMQLVKDKKVTLNKTLSVAFDPTDENAVNLYWRVAVTRSGQSTPDYSPTMPALIKPDPLFTVTPSSGSIIDEMPFSVDVAYTYYACTGPLSRVRVLVLDGSTTVLDKSTDGTSITVDVDEWLPAEKTYTFNVTATTTNSCTNRLQIPVTFRWALPAPPNLEVTPDNAACALNVMVEYGDSIVVSPQSTFPGGSITGSFRGIEFDGSYTATSDEPAGPTSLTFPQLSELTVTVGNVEETEIFGSPYPTVAALPGGPVDTMGITQTGICTVTHRVNSIVVNPAQVVESGYLESGSGHQYVMAQYQVTWADSTPGKPDVSCRELALCDVARREIWTAHDVQVWELKRPALFACSIVNDVFTARFLLPWDTDADIEDSTARASYVSTWAASRPNVWFPCVEYVEDAGDFSDIFGSIPTGVDITITTVADLSAGGCRLYYDACETTTVDLDRCYLLPSGEWSAWERLADGAADGSTVVDILAPFNVPIRYRGVSHSNVGGYNEMISETIYDRSIVALNYGDGFAEHVELEYNPAASYSWDDDSENILFAGYAKPTHFAGTAYPGSRSASCTVVGVDNVRTFERVISKRHDVMIWRDPFGELFRVSTSWKASAVSAVPLAKTYAVTAEEVE